MVPIRFRLFFKNDISETNNIVEIDNTVFPSGKYTGWLLNAEVERIVA